MLAQAKFPGRTAMIVLARAGMSIPTVFIGLMCYGMLSRRGPLGGLDLLYTPWAIVIGQLLLAVPIGALKLDPQLKAELIKQFARAGK